MAEKKCNNCGTNSTPASVPYVVHESAMARAERRTKSLIMSKKDRYLMLCLTSLIKGDIIILPH